MRTLRIAFASLPVGIFVLVAACNSILGIEEVTLGRDGGRDSARQDTGDDPPPPEPEIDGATDPPDTSQPLPSNLQPALMHASTCARKKDGTIFCFGDNTLGQIGDGVEQDGAPPRVPAAKKVTLITDAVAVAAGYDHACALKADRTVACWGYNHYGQLGAGNLQNSLSKPTAVMNIRDVSTLAGGTVFTCATKMDGTAACWGANYAGQLGNASKMDTDVPVAVFNLVDAVAIGAGESHACALRKGGTLACWGSNTQGQLGNGTTSESLVPVPITLTGVTAIAVGGTFSCAIQGGAVLCWGSNAHGELGNGAVNATPNPTPTPVAGLTDAVKIAVGEFHACAVRQAGGVVCWGSNADGELGTGALNDADSNTPMQVAVKFFPTATTAVDIATAGNHTCATTKEQKLFCWGDNGAGQSGDGTTADVLVPFSVPGF